MATAVAALPGKLVSMREAIAAHVHDGDTVIIDGFTHLICFAAGHEIIRQRRRELVLCRLTPDLVYDQMIAAGCARKLVFSWAGNPGAGSLHAFRRAAEGKGPPLELEEYSHFGMVARLSAGAANLPFWPLRDYAGTDLPRVNPQIRTVACPFTGETLAAVPALAPDVAIIASTLVDGSGFEFVGSLPEPSRPHAIVFLSSREEDAVRAFELQATDFVPVPIAIGRLAEAMTRARHQALQIALLRTAEELQRLIGATASSRASIGQLGAPAFTAAISAHATSPRGGNNGPWAPTVADGQDAWRSDGGSDAIAQNHVTATVGSERSRGSFAMTGGRWRNAIAVPVQTAVATRTRPGGSAEGVLDLTQTPEHAGTAMQDGRPLRVLVREGRRTRFIPLADVDWFEADGNYILVHAADQRYRTRGTITAIESGLDPRQFVRIHRRMVVNMDRVREMSPLPGGDGLLVLGGGTTLRLSRTYRARVR